MRGQSDLSRLGATLALLFLVVGRLTGANEVSSSTVDSCVLDGGAGNATPQLSCKTKVVVALAMSQSEGATSEIQAWIGSVANKTTGEKQSLTSPLTIKVTMSPIYIMYPLYYVQSVNGNPTEVYQTHEIVGDICIDGANAINPSCGWAFNDAGQPIPDSQGFCCVCDAGDVFGSDQLTRGNLNCDLFGNQMSSSHCLRFGDSWWETYEAGNSLTWYTVKVTVEQDGKVVGTLELNPTAPAKVTADRNVSAEIIGNFAPSIAIPDMSDKFLTVPRTPWERARVPLANCMWVDKTAFDLSGNTCDKIGVSYTAFREESNRCRNRVGSCLTNQLDDLWNADISRIAAGEPIRNLISRYGSWVLLGSIPESGVTAPMLSLKDPQYRNVLVKLEINADNVRFIDYRSTGKIISVQIRPFAGQALQGRADVLVWNTGSIYAEFWVQITACSEPIAPIPAQKGSIAAQSGMAFPFDLYTTAANARSNQCNVSLYDSQMQFLDASVIMFNTTDRMETNGTQGGTVAPIYSNVGTRNPSAVGCNCGTMDLPCYIIRGCWTQFITIAVTAALIVVGTILLCKFGPRLASMMRPGKSGSSRRAKSGSGSSKKKSKAEANDIEMSQMTETGDEEKASLKLGRSATPMSTPTKKQKTSSATKQSQDSVIAMPVQKLNFGAPSTIASASSPKAPADGAVTQATLQRWEKTSRLVFLNVGDPSIGERFSFYPGEQFSVAGAITSIELPSSEGVASPWCFELCAGYDNQKWYIPDRSTGAKEDIEFCIAAEFSDNVETVLDTATACALVSKSPKYPCINF